MLCIKSRIEDIKNLSINLLDQRQPVLVKLMADIVNVETRNGTLTDKHYYPKGQSYWDFLSDALEEAGFEFLGSGYFSVVYKHHLLPGKVLKVGLKKEDSAAAYVAFCRMHEGREGIPVIHDVQRFEGCYIVVLDELIPIGPSDWYVNKMGELITYAIEYGEDAYRKSVNSYLQEREVTVEFQGLLFTCRMIHDFFNGIATFDMHHGNAMINPKTGRIVITDPVSFTVKQKEPVKVASKVDGRHHIGVNDLGLREKCLQDVVAAANWGHNIERLIQIQSWELEMPGSFKGFPQLNSKALR